MLVNNENIYKEAKLDLANYANFVIDVETNGLDSFNGHEICGVGLSPLESDKSYYFPIRHQQENLPLECYKDLISILSQAESFIGYNIKFDLHFLMKDGMIVDQQNLKDVIVMVRLTEDTTVKELGLTSTLKRAYGDNEQFKLKARPNHCSL